MTSGRKHETQARPCFSRSVSTDESDGGEVPTCSPVGPDAWPFQRLVSSKRPGNEDRPVAVCAITSQFRHAVANWDEEIREVDDDFESSGLKRHSLIRIGKLATVEEEVFEGVLGEISSHRLAAIRSKIADCLERQVAGRENG
jgi:hypothetical protein